MKANRVTKKDGKITKTQVEVPSPIYSVRIKQDLYEPLSTLAATEDRSVTSKINSILRDYLNTVK